MEKFYIKGVKVILDDLGEGRGSIIISNGYDVYEYFWGSMGDTLKDFLLRVSSGYFANKLVGHGESSEFCSKGSLQNVRAYLRENLPWYQFPSAQKELRGELKDLKYCNSDNEFVYEMQNLHSKLMCLDLNRNDEREFLDIIENDLGCEPWRFIETQPSKGVRFLEQFLPLLQKHLKKEKGQEKLVQVNN